ncbi:hypothetical protein GCM10008942_18880 [Rhizomicrobium electricum]|uniref:Uncharacterized protein n=1 Tax=Rhizomicrobium electricum TaxID=480070 RepID=A0ABN1ENC4_9PROT
MSARKIAPTTIARIRFLGVTVVLPENRGRGNGAKYTAGGNRGKRSRPRAPLCRFRIFQKFHLGQVLQRSGIANGRHHG